MPTVYSRLFHIVYLLFCPTAAIVTTSYEQHPAYCHVTHLRGWGSRLRNYTIPDVFPPALDKLEPERPCDAFPPILDMLEPERP